MFYSSSVCFPCTQFKKITLFDGYFDAYSIDTPWRNQKASLDNLAILLSKNSDYIVYIGFESGEKEPLKKVKARANRIIKYLTETRKIERKRIIDVYLEKTANPSVILQPIIKGGKSPFELSADRGKLQSPEKIL